MAQNDLPLFIQNFQNAPGQVALRGGASATPAIPIVGSYPSGGGGGSAPAPIPTPSTGTTAPKSFAELIQNVTAPLGSPERTTQLTKVTQELIKQLADSTPPQLSTQGTPIPTVPTAPVSPSVPVSGVQGLTSSLQIATLEKNLQDTSAKIQAGIFTGREALIGELFKKFGVEQETTIVNDLNKQILETQTRLRKLPEDIKVSLEDVGVNEAQLNRLILKESKGPTELLRDLLEQRGASQDRINQALKFVDIFTDAKIADEAAKIEAFKYDIETNKFFTERLDKLQLKAIDATLNARKEILNTSETAFKNGAPTGVVSYIQSSSSEEEAQQRLAASGYGMSKTQREAESPLSKILTPEQLARTRLAGLSESDSLQITRLLVAGTELEDIRQILREAGLDSTILDFYDRTVGIENIRGIGGKAPTKTSAIAGTISEDTISKIINSTE